MHHDAMFNLKKKTFNLPQPSLPLSFMGKSWDKCFSFNLYIEMLSINKLLHQTTTLGYVQVSMKQSGFCLYKAS